LVGLREPFLGADLLSGGPGAQAGSRRVRAAGVDALTPASTRPGWASRWSGVSAGCGWVEAIDQCLVAVLEVAIVEVGVFAGEGDDLAVILDGLSIVAADLVHQAEAGVAVMDVGEALQQCMGGLLCRVELPGSS